MNSQPTPSLTSTESIVTLNVGGKLFTTTTETLLQKTNNQMPVSEFFDKLILHQHSSLRDGNGTFFIDRNPTYFEILLDYLRTGDVFISPQHVASMQSQQQQSFQENFLHMYYNQFCSRLLREADYFMMDLSHHFYNISQDLLYAANVSSNISKENQRKCLFFFEKDPLMRPASLFLNGVFMNQIFKSRECIVRNGVIEIYHPTMKSQLQYLLYPTSVETNSTPTSTNHSSQNSASMMLPPSTPRYTKWHEMMTQFMNRESASTVNAPPSIGFLIKDVNHVRAIGTICPSTPQETSPINFEKNYFNLEDFAHSLFFEKIDEQRIRVLENRKLSSYLNERTSLNLGTTSLITSNNTGNTSSTSNSTTTSGNNSSIANNTSSNTITNSNSNSNTNNTSILNSPPTASAVAHTLLASSWNGSSSSFHNLLAALSNTSASSSVNTNNGNNNATTNNVNNSNNSNTNTATTSNSNSSGGNGNAHRQRNRLSSMSTGNSLYQQWIESELNLVNSMEDDEEEEYILFDKILDSTPVTTKINNMTTNGPSGSNSGTSTPHRTSLTSQDKITFESVYTKINNNFYARTKQDFIFIESRTRIYRLKGTLQYFELSNKKL